MIDPFNITNYNYSDDELEEFIIFAMAVAGKTAVVINKKVDNFLRLEKSGSPFQKIRAMIRKGTLRENMEKVSLGKYTLLDKGFRQLVEAKLDLRTCSVSDLEKINGISHKTSRFFVLHSRKDPGEIACLDTHIRKWLFEKGYSGNYFELEKAFIKEAKSLGKTTAELDLEIWRENAKQ